MSIDAAEVYLWGTPIGAVVWLPERRLASFEFFDTFLSSGIEVAPLMMPLAPGAYEFPHLATETFRGLPGLLNDSLPDKYGEALIDQWLIRQGRTRGDFTPVEQLCYVGSRGMGALEYRPAKPLTAAESEILDVAELVDLANTALAAKTQLEVQPSQASSTLDDRDLSQIIRVGTSAGGARAKAVIGWNQTTNSVRSGQLDLPAGYDHWLIKFDGIERNRDKGSLFDPQGYGRIEFAYALMATEAGLVMAEARLLEEEKRAHFMTRRFDRPGGNKLHYQSLNGLAHLDYNQPGATSYEQALAIMRELGLPQADLEQQFVRAAFNVAARNQDDHTKNIGFLMDRDGVWHLSPAFDVTYANDQSNRWLARHQMSINGKLDDFVRDDLLELARHANMSPADAARAIDRVNDACANWQTFADAAEIGEVAHRNIDSQFRRL